MTDVVTLSGMDGQMERHCQGWSDRCSDIVRDGVTDIVTLSGME